MLRELTIRDFAIIEKLDLQFDSHMTVLTGETGAGKSIVIDALGLLSGERGSQEFIRKGASKSILQGLFALPQDKTFVDYLEKVGVQGDRGGLIIQRELYRSGHSVCRVNNTLVTLAVLRKIGGRLIDIHGQNDNQALMHVENHLKLLDQFNKRSEVLKHSYQKEFIEYQEHKKDIEKKRSDEKKWVQRLDMLKFQIKEIEEAHLKSGEEDKLNSEKEKLENFQTIREALLQSYQLLSGGEEDLLSRLGSASEIMGKIAAYSENLKTISSTFSTAFYSLQDSAHDISRELDGMEWDEGRLNEVNLRLELINQLERKYGDSVSQILSYCEQIKAELEKMQNAQEDSGKQEEELEKMYQSAYQKALLLSAERKKSAHLLEKKVHTQLKALYMDKAVFQVYFDDSEHELDTSGIDKVEFYVQTNPGEASGPLNKIASGGELSRIMLALKTIFAQDHNVTSIIFDEVDTGVSGRVAQAIAEKISQIAAASQVLCITHLPQVAAISDHHFLVSKHTKRGRTETIVKKLTKNERVAELARMLAGTTITQLTLEHAAELLTMANMQKQSK
ncbi:DNA repair protein RecN [Liquorilactobacillus oeni]|uniref:DNA repair protein RecN n=1 Tax=Liquorilactobacillus oeni DSM 19972 TaxID=1423777 RepID=A0A0R1MGF3_9LACO|nr:DNA repair protein RecN [Liquorilactobacillus oeni]KRL04258.1 DNA repair protein [Liquorilactobacillus oeni DSM 19972]